MMRMRISMREQLCLFVVATTLSALGILAIVTWTYDHSLVVNLRASRLQVIAALKSKQLSQSLLVYTTAAASLASRQGIVNALKQDIVTGEQNSVANWTTASNSLGIVLTSYDDVIFVCVQNGNLTESRMNVTTTDGHSLFPDAEGDLELRDSMGLLTSYNAQAGPPSNISSLIPSVVNVKQGGNIKAEDIPAEGLFLGPVIVQNNTSPVCLGSVTFPIYNNTTVASSLRNTIGYMTVVFDLGALMDVANDTQGLGNSGEIILLGPDHDLNRWDVTSDGHFQVDKDSRFKYLLPPFHDKQLALTTASVGSYPMALKGWKEATTMITTNGSNMNTYNSQGSHVTVGYASVQFAPTNSSMMLLAQQAYGETLQPINDLRSIAVGTVFGVAAVVMLITFPLAHFAVKPITRLQEATKRGGRPPDYTENQHLPFWTRLANRFRPRGPHQSRNRGDDNEMEVGSIIGSRTSSERRAAFHIPQKVAERKHFIKDELTDLTTTFNAMTEELLVQYENLEEKVQQRTMELEGQKRLAESANEAKSMFIANVTHELRTPLNGILGMTNVVMSESDLPPRSRKNLEVVFKSGELLLHLLTDLLTFSKHQVAGAMAQVKLEERPFRIGDFTSQIMALFGNQAVESGIDLSYEVHPPHGVDWEVSGDMNRILQVVINLISNSLKFTPRKGSVQLMIVMDHDQPPHEDDTLSKVGTRTPPGRPTVSGLRFPSEATSSTTYEEKPLRPSLVTRQTSAGIVNPNSELNKNILSNMSVHSIMAQSTSSLSPSDDNTHLRTAWFEFRVIDTGPGVPEHLQSKIFEPFVQGDVGLSRKYGGTGLGLSICAQLATIMGGEIRLKSFGAGSTFTLRIPLRFVAAASRGGAGAPTPRRQASVHSRRSAATNAKRDSQSVHSMLSAAFTAVSVQGVANQDNIRLVGLSSPFFAPSNEPAPKRPATATDHVPAYSTPAPVQPEAAADAQALARAGSVQRSGSAARRPTRTPPPETKSQEPAAAPETADKADAESIKVLVAEDNKVNQKVVVKMLQVEGIRDVTLAEDGQQAVERVLQAQRENKKYDIIFMDVQMPNVDGLQSTRMIRELGYSAPIIALTAFAEEGNVKDCFDSGMDYFLAKPLKRPQIRHVLKTYCHPIVEEAVAAVAAGASSPNPGSSPRLGEGGGGGGGASKGKTPETSTLASRSQ